MKKKINFKEVFPNFITILGLCLGISSIKFAFELNFEKSIYCIVLAAILDDSPAHLGMLFFDGIFRGLCLGLQLGGFVILR